MADKKKAQKVTRMSHRMAKKTVLGTSVNKPDDPFGVGGDDDFVNPSLGNENMNNRQATEGTKSMEQVKKGQSKKKQKKVTDGSAMWIDNPIQNENTEGTQKLAQTKKSHPAKKQKNVIDGKEDAPSKERSPGSKEQAIKEKTEKDIEKGNSEEQSENSEQREGNPEKGRKRKPVKEAEKKSGRKKRRRYHTLLTRTSPLSLFSSIKKLNPKQRAKVTGMGFGSLLKMNLDGIHAGLGYYVVDKYNLEEYEIVIGTGRIKITREYIHDMIGAPLGGMRLSSMTYVESGKVMALRWKKQFTEKAIRPRHVSKLMNMCKVADKYFMQNRTL